VLGEALGGFLAEAQIGVFLDVEAFSDEAELLLIIDVLLQRREVGQPVRVPVIIRLRE
jgi:hypothetical protein